MKRIIILIAFVVLAVSCQTKVNKDVQWPVWASRPIVENMKLVGSNGELEIYAGQKAVYSADINDKYNELAFCTLTITYDGAVATVIDIPVGGNQAHVQEEFVMPFAANLSETLVPEVTLDIVNVANGKASKRLDNDHNISVRRPKVADALYIVDNIGNSFQIKNSEENKYLYSPVSGTDFSALGSSFHIASKVAAGKPDYSDLVWGQVDGAVAVVSEAGDNAIKTPASEGYGFKRIDFDSYSFDISQLVNYTVTVDKATMVSEEQSGVNYLICANQKLVRNCEVVFEGFGNLSDMIQPDRFEILDSKTVKFTGHSRNWTFFYDVDDNWMILNYVNFNEPDQVWVTGAKACFPLGNDSSEHVFNYLSADGKDRYGTLASVQGEDEVYQCEVYLMEGFHIQLYSWVKWSTVISMTSLTPELGEITDDKVYIRQGSEFKPGRYLIRIELTKKADQSGDGAEAVIALISSK